MPPNDNPTASCGHFPDDWQQDAAYKMTRHSMLRALWLCTSRRTEQAWMHHAQAAAVQLDKCHLDALQSSSFGTTACHLGADS